MKVIKMKSVNTNLANASRRKSELIKYIDNEHTAILTQRWLRYQRCLLQRGIILQLKRTVEEETEDMIIIQCIRCSCQWKCHLGKIIPCKKKLT